MSNIVIPETVQADFGLATSAKPKRPSPVSIRFTENERTLLKQRAGQRSISAYVRDKALGEDAAPRRKTRTATADYEMLGKVLGALGQSRLSQNMNQLAKQANMGALDVTPDVTTDLCNACEDIRLMREALIFALGLRPRG